MLDPGIRVTTSCRAADAPTSAAPQPTQATNASFRKRDILAPFFEPCSLGSAGSDLSQLFSADARLLVERGAEDWADIETVAAPGDPEDVELRGRGLEANSKSLLEAGIEQALVIVFEVHGAAGVARDGHEDHP